MFSIDTNGYQCSPLLPLQVLTFGSSSASHIKVPPGGALICLYVLILWLFVIIHYLTQTVFRSLFTFTTCSAYSFWTVARLASSADGSTICLLFLTRSFAINRYYSFSEYGQSRTGNASCVWKVYIATRLSVPPNLDHSILSFWRDFPLLCSCRFGFLNEAARVYLPSLKALTVWMIDLFVVCNCRSILTVLFAMSNFVHSSSCNSCWAYDSLKQGYIGFNINVVKSLDKRIPNFYFQIRG